MNNLENLATAIGTDIKDLKTKTANSQTKISANTESIARIATQMDSLATKSEVKQDIDGLTQTFSKMKIGGTNLLKGSKGPFMPDRKPANFDNNVLYAGQTSIYMEQGQKYIISAKTDGNFTAHHDGNKESDNVVLWIMDKNVRNYQIVSDLKTGTTGTKFVWDKPTGIYHLRVNTYHKETTKSVWDVKIEKGTLATDWSPAPEDAQTQVVETQESLRGLERKFETFKEQQFTKEEFNSKDCITGSTEYQVLKHQVESLVKQTQILQEQLALVKPAPRRAPMAYTIDLNNTPPIAWFDNGCGLDIGGNLILLGANRSQGFGNNAPLYDFPNAIIRTSMGIINVDVWKKANFDYWHATVKVLNPLKSADDYDWTNARLSEQGSLASWRWDNQKNVIRVMYQLGIWDAKTVESLGAVRR
jgi:hypothetical protein